MSVCVVAQRQCHYKEGSIEYFEVAVGMLDNLLLVIVKDKTGFNQAVKFGEDERFFHVGGFLDCKSILVQWRGMEMVYKTDLYQRPRWFNSSVTKYLGRYRGMYL